MLACKQRRPIAEAVLILVVFLTGFNGSTLAAEKSSAPSRGLTAKPTVVLAAASAQEPSTRATRTDQRQSKAIDGLKPIGEIALPLLQVAVDRMPTDTAAKQFGSEPGVLQHGGASRPWNSSLYTWEAPALCHRPLYFEDENLERNGRSFGIFQPAVSTGHACTRLVALPYMMGVVSPHECVYTLGKDRPGTCAPYYLCHPPLSLRGRCTRQERSRGWHSSCLSLIQGLRQAKHAANAAVEAGG